MVPAMQERKRLVAYATGLSATPEDWSELVSRLKSEPCLSGYSWLPLPHGTSALAREGAEEVAARMNDMLCAEFVAFGGFDELILIGHSVGALFLRMAFAKNSGWTNHEPAMAPWSKCVKRFVLMAPLNRGVDCGRASRARLAARVSRALRLLRVRTLVYDLLQGSDFVTNLRLLWLRHLPSLEGRMEIPHVLGENDKEVDRLDCIDTEQFPGSFHIPVPGAGHVRLHDLSSTDNPDRHFRLLFEAITGNSTNARKPDESLRMARAAFMCPASKKTVIFLLHGIRDSKLSWAQPLRDIILRRSPNVSVVLPSHGYVTALRFALPFVHRMVRRKLQDLYTQALAEYPAAEFHAAAHSNGTYILSQAMKSIEAIKFNRLMLGGCVLPRDFDWHLIWARRQVKVIRHDFTRTDIVVAILCSALAGAGRGDVGTAGYNQFNACPEALHENELPEGGHGAAFDSEDDLMSIARFLLDGEEVQRSDLRPPGRVFPGLLSRMATIMWMLLLILLAGVTYCGLVFGGPLAGLLTCLCACSGIAYFLHVM